MNHDGAMRGPTRENFRRLLAEHRHGHVVFTEAGFGFWHPVRRMNRRVKFRAWVGTWWPTGAVLIQRWRDWVFRLRHPQCLKDEECYLDNGHEGPCDLVGDDCEELDGDGGEDA